jgi:putative ABC transport system permease protein
MNRRTEPPRLAMWLLAKRLSTEWHDFVVGDLEEEFVARSRRSLSRARGWFWWQTLRCLAAPPQEHVSAARRQSAGGRKAMRMLLADLRNAIRTLHGTPVVSLAVVLSLALGIGANTAIFSVVNSLLLRTLPVERPDRLVLLLFNANASPSSPFSNPVWEQIRDQHADLFETAFAFSQRSTRFNLGLGGQTDVVDGVYASGQYFAALGVSPMLGRAFTADDDRRGGGAHGPVAVLSYAFWQRRFGGARDVIGKTQTIDGVPFTIIGVMPPSFFGTDVGTRSDVILPIGTELRLRGRDSWLDRTTTHWLLVMGRLKNGQTIESAQAALRGAQPQIRAGTMPVTAGAVDQARWARYFVAPMGVQAAAGGTSAMRARYRQPILAIMTVVALVLMIACANVANLFLARASARRHEFSVRLALGASRWDLARQQLVESMLLSLIGTAAGLVIARWVSDFLVTQLSTQASPVFLDTHLDWRVLTFSTSVAFVVALLFGTVPALRASRTPAVDAIREHGRAGAERRGGISNALVVGQVALSLILVVAASLFVRTFTTLATLNVGFDRDRVLLVRLDVPSSTEPSQRAVLYEEVTARVRTTPGVAHVALSEVTPVSGTITDNYVEVEHGPPLAPPRNISYQNVITPDWFATYGTRLVAGRDFDEHDRGSAPPVVIVNQTFVRRFLREGSPIGRRIRNPPSVSAETRPWMEVIGIVADATYLSLRADVPPTMYVPLAQRPVARLFPVATLSVRSASGPPELLARSVGDAIAGVDSRIAITFTPLKQQVDAALVQERVLAMLSGSFGALALLLSAIGLYGVTAYAVNRRRIEIGIRIAVGASPASVVGLVMARIALLLAVGVSVGTGVSMWASKFVAALLYGVEPRDPVALIGAIVLLLLVAAMTGAVPAWRASRIDPAAVLKEG